MNREQTSTPQATCPFGWVKSEIEKQKKKEVKGGEAGDKATNLKLRSKKQQQLGRSAMTSEQIFLRL